MVIARSIITSIIILMATRHVTSECTENTIFTARYLEANGVLKSAQVLGEGCYGSVSLISWYGMEGKLSLPPTYVVVKTALPENPDTNLAEEARIMQLLHRGKPVKHVPKIYGCYRHGKTDYLVMEFIPGNLNPAIIYRNQEIKKIRSKYNIWGFTTLEPLERMRIYLQMAEGLAEIHSKGIVHGDIKPENMLMSEVSANGWLYIVDYGLSTEGTCPPTTSAKYADLEFIESLKASSLNSRKYECGDRQDIYALALSIFEIETAINPNQFKIMWEVNGHKFTSFENIIEIIHKDVSSMLWCQNTAINFRDTKSELTFESLISQMIACKREKRPTAAEVVEMLNRLISAPQVNISLKQLANAALPQPMPVHIMI